MEGSVTSNFEEVLETIIRCFCTFILYELIVIVILYSETVHLAIVVVHYW